MTGAITIIISVLLIVLDQVIKHFVYINLRPVEVANLIPGFIRLRYVENTGASFGMLSDRLPFLITITVIVIAVGIYVLAFKKLSDKLQYVGAVLILSGGIANLIDRIFRRFVIDYLEFTFVDFAVFNFADCLITVGAALLIISLIRELIKDSKTKKYGEQINV